MALRKDLENELLKALKSKDEVRRNTLRMAISSIKLAEVDNRGELDDSTVFGILQKEIKIREETIAEAQKADRAEMIAPIEAEIQILKDYLPKELSDEELTSLVKKIITDIGASSMKEMGAVMKNAIQEAQGRAANDRISKIIRELLA
ncbi:MAG: GatB/YqeY domain-containing protein [Chloroflexi bacterium]|nr:GatB/YqeY domain-containing protein [Chloroflexota bacterium]